MLCLRHRKPRGRLSGAHPARLAPHSGAEPPPSGYSADRRHVADGPHRQHVPPLRPCLGYRSQRRGTATRRRREPEAEERLIRLGLLGSQSFDTCQGIKLLASVEMVQESVVVPTARALAHNNRSVTKSTT